MISITSRQNCSIGRRNRCKKVIDFDGFVIRLPHSSRPFHSALEIWAGSARVEPTSITELIRRIPNGYATSNSMFVGLGGRRSMVRGYGFRSCGDGFVLSSWRGRCRSGRWTAHARDDRGFRWRSRSSTDRDGTSLFLGCRSQREHALDGAQRRRVYP